MDPRRRLRVLVAGLLLAASAARAADVVSVPDIHPLLLGPVAEAGSPLANALSAQQAALAPLSTTPELIPARLADLAKKGPVESVAAAVLARRLQAEPALPAPAKSALAQIETVHKGLVDAIIDGRAPGLALDDVRVGPKLRAGGQKIAPLGQGEFGIVFPHPRVEGAVVKVVEHSFEVLLFGAQTPQQTAQEEQATARALAAAGVGPRHFGNTVKDGRHVSVRERVYGDTLQRLADRRELGLAEKELVMDMLRRMAAAGLKVDDMRMSNVMIGRTLVDPERRAYIVDGGKVLAPEAHGADERLAELYHQQILLMGRFDPNVGWVEFRRPFSRLLDDALARAGDKTRWQRFKRALKDILSSPMAPPLR